MGNAYGFIEITGVVAAVDALDIMCKAADVSLATWERKLGGRLVTLVVEGEVAAVKQAIEAGSTRALKKPAAVGVIPNPHPEIVRIVQLSASRFKGKAEPSSQARMLGEDPPDFVPKETGGVPDGIVDGKMKADAPGGSGDGKMKKDDVPGGNGSGKQKTSKTKKQ